ncbi:MAG: Shedu anti-phage system protein SduA domain-containing protein [Candidatus Magasanikbacteria bacterium]
MKRIGITKTIRFEVFKRDKFTCNYCGRKAPDIVLHVDHIEPVSKGGTNDIINLITSCYECNLGKSDKKLGDNSAVEIQRRQLELLQEKREQMELMVKWRKSLSKFDDQTVNIVKDYLDPKIVHTLSSEDKEAVMSFLPDFIASESVGSVNLLKATTEIKSLKELAEHLEQGIQTNHTESWWQNFIRKNILIIQQGYIKSIEKLNIGIGNTKFPDFSLVTHDNYLDILEIKRPNTNLMKFDESRSNYYWDIELSKAIIQVENYLSNLSTHRDAVRTYLKDNHEIDLQVLRPRGIILSGDCSKFKNQKERDDFRLLSHSLKNIVVISYDELLNRLRNYIRVLEKFSERIEQPKSC